jgi:hypothetical protein
MVQQVCQMVITRVGEESREGGVWSGGKETDKSNGSGNYHHCRREGGCSTPITDGEKDV